MQNITIPVTELSIYENLVSVTHRLCSSIWYKNYPGPTCISIWKCRKHWEFTICYINAKVLKNAKHCHNNNWSFNIWNLVGCAYLRKRFWLFALFNYTLPVKPPYIYMLHNVPFRTCTCEGTHYIANCKDGACYSFSKNRILAFMQNVAWNKSWGENVWKSQSVHTQSIHV